MTELVPARLGSRWAAILAVWLAFGVAVSLALPQPPKPSQIALGLALGAALVLLGYLASSRVRESVVRTAGSRAVLTVGSLLAGALVGALLLMALVALSKVEPALHARFAGRLAEPWWRPFALAFESSILEEVTFRLFVMSVVAWLVTRLTPRPNVVFSVAVAVSALLFGLAHLPAWLSVAHVSVPLVACVLLMNGVGGVLFAWVYWRWGVPYAILCHFSGDVVIQSLGPRWLA